MLAFTSFQSYLPLHIVPLLNWTLLSKTRSLELSLSLSECDKLGLSLLNTLEFVWNIRCVSDINANQRKNGTNVNKLAKFKISGKSSQKFFISVKKVNKLERSKNLSPTSCLDVSSVQSILRFFFHSSCYSFNFPLQIYCQLYQQILQFFWFLLFFQKT